MIFMLQMQYNALNCMYVFQKISGVTPPDPLLVLGQRIGPHPIQNPGCAPGGKRGESGEREERERERNIISLTVIPIHGWERTC